MPEFMHNVDLAAWDMATACGSCHFGGAIVEKGFNDNLRHSMRQPDMTGATANAYTHYNAEYFTPGAGVPAHYVNNVCMNSPLNNDGTPVEPGQPLLLPPGACPPSPNNVTIVPSDADPFSHGFMPAFAPWSMPATFDNKYTAGNGSNAVVPGMFVPGAQGWAPEMYVNMGMAVTGQMMMPNVRELDCFMCHLDGYNNIINSAAVQMGYLNAAPSMSGGLMNMFSQGYMPGTYVLGTPFPGFEAFGAPASLSGTFLQKLKGEPLESNCRQCHSPTTMANMPDMFDKFLGAAPMQYNGDPSQQPNGSLLNGMAMPGYDLNSPFVPPNATSPEVELNFGTGFWQYVGGGDASGPFGIFPMALDAEWGMFSAPGVPNTGVAGGGKTGETGPLFYAGRIPTLQAPMGDQNALKKATIPFPRADFFKRGDIWDNKDQDVHYAISCAGCHFNTESLNPNLSQCDPGRGFERMGGIEGGQVGIDTRNTVKRCQDCHVTGTNIDGVAIETFGAPNPTAAHSAAGLLAPLTTARGWDGSALVDLPDSTHLDVMDCTVCHIYKKSMAVRSLDSTSGNRYPAMIGYDMSKGMMGMFTDPMGADNLSDEQAIGAVTYNMSNQGFKPEAINMMMSMVLYGAEAMFGQIMADAPDGPMFQMFAAMALQPNGAYPDLNAAFAALGPVLPQYFPGMPPGSTLGDAARAMLKAEMQQWQPLYGWAPNKAKANGVADEDYRIRLVPINMIVAQMWDDRNGSFDANGDTAEQNSNWNGHIEWDPPIARNMKAGMNFAGGPFATIPMGFGSGSYASAYNPDNTLSGAFKFVGVYGGNIMLTTPEEISAYKAHRNTLADGINDDWSGTQLVFFGGNPFQVTHNVVTTDQFVIGKSCNDCHAPGAGFFSGDYDMTGTGVPATASYDYDASGYTFGLDMANNISTSNMMQRPVVDFEVVALAADLRTGSEAFGRDGTVHDVEFEELGCWSGTVFTPNGTNGCNSTAYKATRKMGRDEFMYPELAHDDAARTAKIAALENPALGAAPSATIATVGGAAPTASNVAVSVTAGVAAAFVAADGSALTPTYSWNFGDGTTATGQSVNKTYSKAGTYNVVLTVTDSLGRFTKATQYVKAAATATPAGGSLAWVDNDATLSTTFDGTLNVDLTGITHTKIYVLWNDLKANQTVLGTGSFAVNHTFRALSLRLVDTDADTIKDTYRYPVKVRVYNGTALVKELTTNVDIAKP